MKVSSLFSLSKLKIQLYLNLHPPVAEEILYSYILNFEEVLTRTELARILAILQNNNEMTDLSAVQLTLQPIIEFLKNRWNRLKNFPPLHYTTHFNTVLTDVCLSLATELAALKIYPRQSNTASLSVEYRHRYEFLMPGIQFENRITGLNLNEQDQGYDDITGQTLELHQFILDEKLQIIHIHDCLKQSELDNQFKHTSSLTAQGQAVPLSDILRLRVIYHSKVTTRICEYLNELKHYKENSNTLGGALARLSFALKNAGIAGSLGGTDDNAARDVFVGIKAFYNYSAALPDNLRDYLFALKINETIEGRFQFIFSKLMLMANYSDYEPFLLPNEIEFLQNYIEQESAQRLSQQNDVEVQEWVFTSCVNEMADMVSQFILLYPVLYHINPSCTQALFEECIPVIANDTGHENPYQKNLESQTAFLFEQLAQKSALCLRYTQAELRSLTALQGKPGFLVNDEKLLRPFARQLITSPELLFCQMLSMPLFIKYDLMKDIMKRRAINKLFKRFAVLKNNLLGNHFLNSHEKELITSMLFKLMGSAKLRQLIKTPDELYALLPIISSATMMTLIEKGLGVEHINNMFQHNKVLIQHFILALPSNQQMRVCNLFEILHIPPEMVHQQRFSLFYRSATDSIQKKRHHPEEDEVAHNALSPKRPKRDWVNADETDLTGAETLPNLEVRGIGLRR